MELKKHERLAYRLSDIIIRLNNGERLDIFELADIYKVSIRTLKRDFQDRLTALDFSEAGPQFYCLNAKKIGYLDITDIKRFANFASVQDLLPKNARFHKNKRIQNLLNRHGHCILWLPPYSPDLNPIEKKWAEAKFLRQGRMENDLSKLFYDICPNYNNFILN